MVANAQSQQASYLDLIKMLIEKEISHRKLKDVQKRTKMARLPLNYNLDFYDFSLPNGLDKQQLNQLRELSWLEQNFILS